MTSTALPAAQPTHAAAPDGAMVTVGEISAAGDGKIAFAPRNTNYRMHLAPITGHTGPSDQVVRGYIRMEARKLWTVPSGGNFISPLFGSPRTVQGRVRAIGDRWIVVQSAGALIRISLEKADAALDLSNGPVVVGAMVNAMVMAGATFELA